MTALQEQLTAFRKPSPLRALGNGVPYGTPSSQSQARRAWQQILEKLEHRSDLCDDDLQPPTTEVLNNAAEFIIFCRDHGVEPPMRIVPDGSGGVVFEWRAHPYFYSVEFHASDRAELLIFENSKLLTREPIG